VRLTLVDPLLAVVTLAPGHLESLVKAGSEDPRPRTVLPA
jgi:hypothetical protein